MDIGNYFSLRRYKIYGTNQKYIQLLIIIQIEFWINMRLQLKVKSHGHSVCTKIIKQESLANQIIYYLQNFRMPININVNQIKSSQENDRVFKKLQIGEQLPQQNPTQQDYDIGVLSQQVMLFDSDRQIQDYIASQKLLAHDVQEKLSRLCKALILVANQQFQKKRQFGSFSQLIENVCEKNITKEQLNQIELKCMQTLNRVQEQRKKLQLCVICWQNMSNIILIPCMHLVMCGKCPKVRGCPVCKKTISSSSIVYR